jgi:hypothetical protein
MLTALVPRNNLCRLKARIPSRRTTIPFRQAGVKEWPSAILSRESLPEGERERRAFTGRLLRFLLTATSQEFLPCITTEFYFR